MKLICPENADLDLSTEKVVLAYTLATAPVALHLKAEIRAGDGAKDIAGGGAYRVRVTVAGVEVFRSDVLVVAGVTRRIFDVEFFARADEEVILYLLGLAADVDVDVTAYLYTGVNAVEVSDDAVAADKLEEFLNGTDGAGVILRAEQLKLYCDAPGEGALDCENVSIAGFGQHNAGGLYGQYNSGANGQVNEGTGFGQVNISSGGADYAGQINAGETAQWNEGGGATPIALKLTGAADVLDDILADTDALQQWWTADGTLYDLLAAVSLGTGAVEWTYTTYEPDGTTPIPDVYCRVTSDEAGLYAVAAAYTDQYGERTFNLDAGTVYVWRKKSGYTFVNPDVEVVEEE